MRDVAWVPLRCRRHGSGGLLVGAHFAVLRRPRNCSSCPSHHSSSGISRSPMMACTRSSCSRSASHGDCPAAGVSLATVAILANRMDLQTSKTQKQEPCYSAGVVALTQGPSRSHDPGMVPLTSWSGPSGNRLSFLGSPTARGSFRAYRTFGTLLRPGKP